MSKKYDREGGRLYNPKLTGIFFGLLRTDFKDYRIRIKTYCMLKRLINKKEKQLT